ncbi:MAG: hypothetical protein COT73_08875, partial [Bdellovibrio sp. CG10_big_fil_rev_8_21_14_0_10_47_8]
FANPNGDFIPSAECGLMLLNDSMSWFGFWSLILASLLPMFLSILYFYMCYRKELSEVEWLKKLLVDIQSIK